MPRPKKTTTEDQVKKGYNEKNPAQPQGVFKPDTEEQPAYPPKTNTLKLKEKEDGNK
ncbi:hypothetical protein [Parasediminibacterium sp. JCM 36343]|uniref:hypothetical protein n=1 Tax=Parasediminibacterium sp. JCM 36343 TaxID=3374279 RepID=UPI00397A2EB4